MPSKTYYQDNKERLSAYNRDWRAKNKNKRLAYVKSWRDKNKEKEAGYQRRYKESDRDKRLLRTYGITAAERSKMEADQHGLCAICSKPPRGKHPLHIDHDHVTGKIRALLCQGCNAGLGHFAENPSALISAAAYLEIHSAR